MQMGRLFLLFLVLVVSAGCARYSHLPAGTVTEISSPVIEQERVVLPLHEVDRVDREYRLGAGDVLAVNVPGVSSVTSSGAVDNIQGYRIYGSGKVLLPLVGGVSVEGLTVDEAQEKLHVLYRSYINEPIISVEILEYKSQPIYLLGSFNTPGVQYLDRATSLVQGIALGGGLLPSADLRGARLVRGDNLVPVDIFELMYRGDMRQNIQLRSGDTVYVPGNEQQQVFVFGAVSNEGAISMLNGRLSLVQALSAAGLGKLSYDSEHIRIIRSYSATQGELMVVDLAQIMRGEAMPLPLSDGDIVYVPRSGIGDWNQALAEMLPTLQTVSSILQPFVQIKYLRE